MSTYSQFVRFFTFPVLSFGLLLFFACQNPSGKTSEKIHPKHSSIDSLVQVAEKSASTNIVLSEMYLKQALDILNKEPYSLGQARYHKAKGRYYYYLDKYDSSLIQFDNAIAIYKEIENDDELAQTYSFFCTSLALQGKFPEALEYGLMAADLMESQGNTKQLAGNYNLISNIYLHQKRFNQALIYNKLSAANISDTLSLQYANILSSKGKIYNMKGDLDSALLYFTSAYNIRLRCANIRHIASSLVQLAELKFMKEDYESARLNLCETINIYEKLNEKTGLFNSYYFLAKIDLAEKQSDLALQHAKQAYTLATEMENILHKIMAEKILVDIYQSKGQYKKALELYKQYQIHYAEQNSAEKSKLLTDIEYKHELENQTKDNQILNQQNKLKKQQLWLLSFIIAALLLMLITLAIYTRMRNRINKQKQDILKADKEMAESHNILLENDKTLLEKDLEIKNRELTSKTVELIRQIETLQSLNTKLNAIKNPESKQELENILNELNISTKENIWAEFHTAFNNVHKEFYDKLFERCPDLSSTEIKIAALLKLNLSTKEIAAISYKSESAVKTARHRLRQKLQLPQDKNLLNFLMRI